MADSKRTRNLELDNLPISPNPDWQPKLKLNKVGIRRGEDDPRAFSWFLVDSEDTHRMYLTSKGGVPQWSNVPCRTQQEGKERNATILEFAKTVLNPKEPMTLRHLFYMLVTAGLVTNCEADYGILSGILTDAREDGEVDDESITDGHRTVTKHSGYDRVRDFADLAPYYYNRNLWHSQDTYCEFWFEKAAIMSTVMSLHRDYQITMRPFKGQASRTYCKDIAKDFARIEKPITVYYCGDHDPSGYAIPRSGEQRVREILHNDYGSVNEDFEFIRLGFNPVHFDEHDLPSWDAGTKKKDSNYLRFIEEYGWLTDEDDKPKCAEIDAIPPNELRTMIENAIVRHRTDKDAWDNLLDVQDTERKAIEKALRKL